MAIDVKDLRPIKPDEELVIDGYFYIKQEDGTFQTAIISTWEYDRIENETPWQICVILHDWEQMKKENKVFIRRNKPWECFGFK